MHEINEYYKKSKFALKAGNYAEGAEHALTGIKLAKRNGQEELNSLIQHAFEDGLQPGFPLSRE